jgi:hypothetical protein
MSRTSYGGRHLLLDQVQWYGEGEPRLARLEAVGDLLQLLDAVTGLVLGGGVDGEPLASAQEIPLDLPLGHI